MNQSSTAPADRRLRNTGISRARRMRREAMEPLLAGDVSYLNSMFAALDASYGGVERYLASLGIDSVAREALRARLLG